MSPLEILVVTCLVVSISMLVVHHIAVHRMVRGIEQEWQQYLEELQMSIEDSYKAGLKAGYIDESLGILEPEQGYQDTDPYLRGVEAGRASWRRDVNAMPALPEGDEGA